MATESQLVDLLDAIGDRAPSPRRTLERLDQPGRAAGPPRRWLPVAATVAAVVASVVVGLVLRGGGSADIAAAGPTVDRDFYSLPLDRYHATAEQERTLQRALFVLARRCAATRGVTVPVAQLPPADPRPDFLAETANNIRPLTVQQARGIGYDLYPGGTSTLETVTKGLTVQQDEIYEGWHDGGSLPRPTDPFLLQGGCYGRAELTLLRGATPAKEKDVTFLDGHPGLFEDDTIVLNDYGNASRSGEQTPEMVQAQHRWSSCMAAHGYPGLHTTEDAIGNGSMTSDTAVRRAVRDVGCKQSTGFMTVWVDSMTQAQQDVISAHRSELDGFRARLATRLANAEAVLK